MCLYRCLETVVPGNSLGKIHQLSVQLLSEGLFQLGILPRASLDDFRRGLYRWGQVDIMVQLWCQLHRVLGNLDCMQESHTAVCVCTAIMPLGYFLASHAGSCACSPCPGTSTVILLVTTWVWMSMTPTPSALIAPWSQGW